LVITIVAFLISLSFQVLAPVGLAIALRRRLGGSWTAFLLGAVVFAVVNLLTWQPLSTYLDQSIGSRLQDPTSSFIWLVAMAGVGAFLEEGGRWVGFRWLFARFGLQLGPQEALMSGLGHAAVETSLLIAGLTFMHLTLYLLLRSVDITFLLESLGAAPQDELVNTLASLAATRWDQPLWIGLDRAFSLLHQLAWALLVAQSLLSRQKRWFAYALFYHFGVAVIVPGVATLGGLALAEIVNAVLGACSALIALWLISVNGVDFQGPETASTHAVPPGI
jgi:uncharacterized membrane protein YhfC